MTARDLATLAIRTIKDFPEYYHYYGQMDYEFNNIKQGNRNPLLYKNVGADGLKTGHTEEAGYSLTASVLRGDRRIVVVLGGLPTMKARGQESERLIEWAFREFNDYRLFSAGDKVEDADVWLGTEGRVPLTVAKDFVVTLPRKARKDMKVTAQYDRPIAGADQGRRCGRQARRQLGRFAAGRGAAGRGRECRADGRARPHRDIGGLSRLGRPALSTRWREAG